MKTLKIIMLGLLLAALATTGNIASGATTGELLQQGLYAEEVEGNLDSAIKAYDQIIKNGSAPPNHVAQALYREGMCYLKLKDEASARAALEKLVADYPGQTEIVEKARPILDELTDFDPATLMPAGTLAYVEFGSPGRQVETILTLLKGTPFENPLAAVAGRQATNSNQKSPGDIVAALLNPSMMAEFKKIRSAAIGITGIAQNNPPTVSVLYPGKSDALRGLILAALGMAGTPGQPIEGMQTVTIKSAGAVAYDDKVIIYAQPASQLQWCVKQYKGLTSEPTLASSNKSFAKLGKAQRQKNAVTVWVHADEAYARLLQMFPAGQVPSGILSANAIADFNNIDELILVESVETNGLGWNADIEFKDGHHCLAYNLIRTPNINPAALAAVPAEAVALASFSLNQTDPAQADKVRAQIQNVTGLDVGREIFANVEQVTLFAMPAGGNATSSATNMFGPDRLGLAITSRNPEQTRQVLTTLLGVMSAGQQNTNAGQYKIGKGGQGNLYCYVEQVNGTTLLSLNRDVVNASVTAIKNHKSVCVSGPLNNAVNALAPTASKLVLVNAGGAIRLLGPQMKVGTLNEEQAGQLNTSLDQLARAADATTIELRTDEQPNDFAVSAGITGIPPLNQVLGPATQITRIANEARTEAAARRLRQESPATILPAASMPIIDGKVDDLWNAAKPYKIANVIYGPPPSSNDLSADYKAMWDENNLYLLVDVTDDILKHDTSPEDWYDSDSVEVYIDATDSKSAEYGQTDYQYGFIWDKTSPQMLESKHNRTNGVQYALVTTDKGYRVEIKFPWSTLGTKPSAGARIGLDVQVNDNDAGGKRKAKIAWHATEDNAWENPQAFGNAELAGLVGWWKFDETQGKTAKDSSGGNHTGTLVGHAKWGQGKIGGAVDLDGHDSFVRIADKSAFDFAGAVSVSCWVQIRTVPVGWMAIVTKGDNSWRLSTSNQEEKFHFSVNDWDRAAINGATTVNPGEWHYVAGVYDGSAMSLYVDGKLDATHPWTEGIGRNNFDLLIGENAEKKGRCFDGLIDDVRVYNYALSESEIKTLAAGQ
jgi:tetratricopeptide (TPR) repeat protein